MPTRFCLYAWSYCANPTRTIHYSRCPWWMAGFLSNFIASTASDLWLTAGILCYIIVRWHLTPLPPKVRVVLKSNHDMVHQHYHNYHLPILEWGYYTSHSDRPNRTRSRTTAAMLYLSTSPLQDLSYFASSICFLVQDRNTTDGKFLD